MKADVYFPNHMIREVPHTSKAVFDIVQRFIQDIGVPTIVRFEKCVEKLWKLSKPTATPPPYPAQHAHPSASPPGSSIFTYYGQRQSVIVLSDSDDDDEDTTLSDQLSACLEKQSELNTELCQVQEILQQTEGALANSQRREQELLAQIDRITKPFSSQPRQALTPSSSCTTPLTPKRVSSSRTRPGSSNVWVSSGTPSRYSSNSPALLSLTCGAASNSTIHSPVTPAKATPAIAYLTFIQANHLDDKYAAIDLIRRNIGMSKWNNELLDLGVGHALVAELVSLMHSYTDELEQSISSSLA